MIVILYIQIWLVVTPLYIGSNWEIIGYLHEISQVYPLVGRYLNITDIYTLWWTNIAIENGHLEWIFPLKIVIFHCYVSSPEGTCK